MANHHLHALLLLAAVTVVAGLRAVSSHQLERKDTGSAADEPLLVFLLRVAASSTALLLIALLLLLPTSGSDSKEHAPNFDPTLTFREDAGVTKLVELHPGGKPKAPLPRVTAAQVAEHSSMEDLWVTIDGRAYDLTKFVQRHPGGIGPVINMAGKDISDVFDNYHTERTYKTMLPQFLVGEVADVEVHPHVSAFRKIRQELLRRGLFETDMRFYLMHGLWLTTLYFGSLYLSLGAASAVPEAPTAIRMVGAAMMGVFWQQLAGIGHDLGHSGVTHKFHTDHRIGSLLSFFMGLSVCWWKSDHNTHHVVCNAVEHDPNIQHMPILAVTPKIFRRPRFWDTYHKKWVGMDLIARTLVSYQHIFFYPVMAVARINLYVQGILYLLMCPDKVHYQKTELTCLAGFFFWLVNLVLQMPTWQEAVGWVAISHSIAGLLHVQIVLSHWSMHCYEGRAYTGRDDEWYITQLRTTMNVATPKWADWVHIGLQFQIEHHLFPRLPRHNLRIAREMVKAVCDKHFSVGDKRFPTGHAYHEPTFFAGNLEMWRQLKTTAMAARGAKKDAASGFYESAIWDGLNIAG